MAPFVLPAPLALAEKGHVSGKELIRAIAIGIETSVRFGMALPRGGPIADGLPAPAEVVGYSWNIFGGTAASGVIMGLDPAKMTHALGIAGVVAPVNTTKKFSTTSPMAMSKYGMAGWVCGAAVRSALLADMGYTGDATVLDGKYGFWRFSGYTQWRPSAIIEQLGKTWHFVKGMDYKIYPCCGLAHTALDCFINIITKNDIQPQDIDTITIYYDPYALQSIWQNKEIKSPMDAQFSVPYNFAVAAHRIEPGPEWQAEATMQNPSILKLMQRVRVKAHPEYTKVAQEDHNAKLAKVEVVAKGRTFSEERRYPKGRSITESTTLSDGELVDKFNDLASRILPSNKVKRAVSSIMSLEEKRNIAVVMKNVVV